MCVRVCVGRVRLSELCASHGGTSTAENKGQLIEQRTALVFRLTSVDVAVEDPNKVVVLAQDQG